MTAVTLFWMNQQNASRNIYSEKNKRKLEDLWHQYEKLFNLKEGEGTTLLFRIGYGKHVKVKTMRKDIKDFELYIPPE